MNNKKLYKLIGIGHLMINAPAIIICFGLPMLSLFLFENVALKITLAIVGFVLGILISWLLWSFAVTKWRLWAFGQLEEDDWYRLKELAIVNKLIWEDGSVFESTEIRSNSENAAIVNIGNLVKEQEQIEGVKLDLNTPSELRFGVNKLEFYSEAFTKALLIIIGIGLFFTNQIVLGVIMLVIVFFSGDGYKPWLYFFNKSDSLIVDSTGIQFFLSYTSKYQMGGSGTHLGAS